MSTDDPSTHYQKLPYKYKPEPLNTQQINTAKKTIDNNHPLARIPLLKALPYLYYCRCCLRKPKKDFRLAMRKALLKKMDMKMPKTDIKLEEDPFLRLGFGMNAYYDTLKYMMILMMLLFTFSLPSVFIYSSYSGIVKNSMGFITRFSLGNMGGTEALCKFAPVSSSALFMGCASGLLNSEGENLQFGIIPSTESKKNYCLPSEFSSPCTLDEASIRSFISTACNNNPGCEVDIAQFRSFVTSTDPSCLGDEGTIFIQMPCDFTSQELSVRRVEGLLIASMGVFICLFFVVYLDYLRNIFKNLNIEWDVKTITAGDYSVELDISQKMWDNFLKDVYKPELAATKLVQFRKYLEHKLEDNLSALPDLGYEDEPVQRVNIAMLTFAFDNAQLINLLKQRGMHIKFEKYDKMRELNKKIDGLIDQNTAKYNRPVTAFLTLENEEGLNRCKNYKDTCSEQEYAQYKSVLGQEIEFQDAAEPTDIIWENRHFTSWDRIKRTMIVCAVVFVLLSISFSFIFICSQEANRPLLKYPATNCQEIQQTFGSAFQSAAFSEWDRNFEANGHTEVSDPVYTGILKCYCDLSRKEVQGFNADTYVSGVRSGSNSTSEQQICKTYIDDTMFARVLGGVMSFSIVVINTILRLIMITLIKWIGEDTHSQQLKSITNGVFIAQFLNTGFLILLVQANLKEVDFPLADSVFNGPFYDYLPLWYTAVGYKLTQTMIINSVFPTIEFGIAYARAWVFRRMDRSWGSDTYKTKKTSIQLYVDLYSGPEYMIHFKYSGIMNVTFVTMMYGLGVPILFPIAAFSYFVLYTVERLTTSYFYQLPPTFDDQMTKNALGNLRWAAVFYLFFGYWMLSSRVIFDNFYHLIPDSTTKMLSGHTFSSISVDQAAPLLLIGVCIFVIIVMQSHFKKTLKRWGFTFGGSKINVDENLPKFFEAIRLRDTDWIIAENRNLKEEYGFSIVSRKIMQILDTVGSPKKAIQGVPYYIILANPLYSRDFQYISCDVPDRDNLIKDDDEDEDNDCEQSDIVSILLNMGFIPDEVIQEFSFQTGFHKKFKTSMDSYLTKKNKPTIGERKARASQQSKPSVQGPNRLLTVLAKNF